MFLDLPGDEARAALFAKLLGDAKHALGAKELHEATAKSATRHLKVGNCP